MLSRGGNPSQSVFTRQSSLFGVWKYSIWCNTTSSLSQTTQKLNINILNPQTKVLFPMLCCQWKALSLQRQTESSLNRTYGLSIGYLVPFLPLEYYKGPTKKQTWLTPAPLNTVQDVSLKKPEVVQLSNTFFFTWTLLIIFSPNLSRYKRLMLSVCFFFISVHYYNLPAEYIFCMRKSG